MGLELFAVAIGLLLLFAVLDLVVGVSNHAVNFLNSSFGSKVAPRWAVMSIASVGIIAGVTFSSGMMEIARKGIFVPHFFTMPELITIFLAVMLTDIILLDLFNSFGLPTSTTVSIVFELLGAAVAISLIKITQAGESISELGKYINSGKALTIIIGILLSIIVAFVCGSFVQFLSRLLFTFRYMDKIQRYGAMWGGVALSCIIYFILVKGAKGAVFISNAQIIWIKTHTWTLLGWTFLASAILLQMLLCFKVNIFKPIILIGTFALAMAFAANDLVNFIGVPLAGLQALKVAKLSNNPLTTPMSALGEKLQSDGYLLVIAGLIMVLTLWLSRKARTVSETELSLVAQEEGLEKFESNFVARRLVRMFISFFSILRGLIPRPLLAELSRRMDASQYQVITDDDNKPSFDLLRASVNLMVASVIISYATSQKLPLSTTYVTFMVSMGTSFADRSWGRDSAVYRVSGVLTVIGGWFLTALLAFSLCAFFSTMVFFLQAPGVILLASLSAYTFWKNHSHHRDRMKEAQEDTVFNLKKVTNVEETIAITFKHMGFLIQEIQKSLDNVMNGLFEFNEYSLKKERKRTRKIQHWGNIIIANIFKSLRLLQREDIPLTYKYPSVIRQLQKLSDGHRDTVARAYKHVSNNHSGLLQEQIDELKQVHSMMNEILDEVESVMSRRKDLDSIRLADLNSSIRGMADNLNKNQIRRIHNGTSKTRLSILFYALIGNSLMISKQNLKQVKIFEESFSDITIQSDDDFE
ncbi:inorganic phosphate transporter [bacterium]|nr:inorganic phosphate transporter [bacterium]